MIEPWRLELTYYDLEALLIESLIPYSIRRAEKLLMIARIVEMRSSHFIKSSLPLPL